MEGAAALRDLRKLSVAELRELLRKAGATEEDLKGAQLGNSPFPAVMRCSAPELLCKPAWRRPLAGSMQLPQVLGGCRAACTVQDVADACHTCLQRP